MTAAPILTCFGGDLTADDYARLAARWITRELADEAGIRRVDSITGHEMFGRKSGGNLAGLIIPNVRPEDSHVREYRIRLDHPLLESRADGTVKESRKYLQPPGRGNIAYLPIGVPAAMLDDTGMMAVVVEGEFKSLALWRLANLNSTTTPRFLPIGLTGVWSWRGVTGKTTGPKGERQDVQGVIADLEGISWKGRRVIIAFDADIEKNVAVRGARWGLTAALIERGATIGNLEWPLAEGKGIDDRLATVGPDKVLADIAAVQFGDWHARLLRSDKGKLLPCYDNASKFLECSPEWAGVLGFNSFTSAHEVLKEPPAPITAKVGEEIQDHFDIEVTRWLERKGVLVKPAVVRSVVDAIARRSARHPVQAYLASLPAWDGESRAERWLTDYCGAEESDYAAAVGKKFLISAVARVECRDEAGVKADCVLILESPQGFGKGRLLRALAGDQWFTDQIADLGSKDCSMQLRGVWFVELNELDVLSRAEMARAKAFFSQQRERFRQPYGHRIVSVPRQCVFVGTSNSDSWLKDETGGRRFWPVRCRHHLDDEGIRRDRDLLWAEALHLYRAGETWWLDDAHVIQEAIAEQKARYDADVWQDIVERWIEDPTQRRDEQGHPVADISSDTKSVTTEDVLAHAVGKRQDLWTQADKNRVARCLVAVGWERFRQREGDRLVWRYRRKEQA